MKGEVTLVCLMVLCMVDMMSAQACSSKSNGCSVPFNLNYFFKARFTPACDKHDVCYSCGTVKGISRNRCDSAFWKDLKNICAAYKNSDDLATNTWCNMVSYDYYVAVRAGGHSHFEKTSPSWCSQHWVSSCLP